MGRKLGHRGMGGKGGRAAVDRLGHGRTRGGLSESNESF